MAFLVKKKKVRKAASGKKKPVKRTAREKRVVKKSTINKSANEKPVKSTAVEKRVKKRPTTKKSAQKKLIKATAIKKPVTKKLSTRNNEPNLKELIRRGKVMFKKPGEDSDKLVMRTRDVEIALECSERTARRRMTKIRKALNLQKGDPVPVKQFCSMMKLEEADVQRKLKAY